MKSKLIAIMLILNISVYAQPYIGTSVINKGFGATVGVIADNRFDVAFNYQQPFICVLSPISTSLSVGYIINITNDEEDNYTITPSFGIVSSKFKIVIPANTRYDKYEDATPYERIKTIRTGNAYYNIELGKDSYMGRVFVKSSYFGNHLYYGIGMRVFFNRNIL